VTARQKSSRWLIKLSRHRHLIDDGGYAVDKLKEALAALDGRTHLRLARAVPQAGKGSGSIHRLRRCLGSRRGGSKSSP